MTDLLVGCALLLPQVARHNFAVRTFRGSLSSSEQAEVLLVMKVWVRLCQARLVENLEGI